MVERIDILGFYVKDPAASVEFYRKLGFEVVSGRGDDREVRLGEMRLSLIAAESARSLGEAFQREAFFEPKGTGVYINVRVSDVDAFYRKLRGQRIKTSSEPRDWPWGHREFVARDPDGYKLVFYQKID